MDRARAISPADSRPNGITLPPRRDFLLAIAGGLCLAGVHGIHHIYSNQTQYFLLGFRLADRGFIPLDWFVWSTTHHHFAFGYFQAALQKIGGFLYTAIATQVALTIGFAFGLLLLTRRFCRHSIPVYLLVLLWLGLSDPFQAGIGGFSLISNFLQPSGVAGALMILGMALLFDRRFAQAGICLALGGLFHASILLAMAPSVCVLAYMSQPWRHRRDLLSFSLPIVVLWGVVFVFLVRHGLGEDPLLLEGLRVQFQVRSPHHHLLALWNHRQTASWLLWMTAGVWALLHAGPDRRYRELRTVFAVSTLTVLAGVVLANWPETRSTVLAKINLLPLFRIGAWPFLLALVVFLDRWADLFFGDGSTTRRGGFCAGLMIVAGAAWVATTPFAGPRLLRVLWILALPAIRATAGLAKRLRVQGLSARRLTHALLIGLIIIALRGLVNRSTVWRVEPFAEILETIREQTPADAILVTPVLMDKTRVLAHRAVVVDEKCFSAVPSESVAWYRRMCDVCGLTPKPRSGRPRWEDGYRELDTARALKLKRLYGATHVVVERSAHRGSTRGLIEVDRGPRFRLLRIP